MDHLRIPIKQTSRAQEKDRDLPCRNIGNFCSGLAVAKNERGSCEKESELPYEVRKITP